MLKCCGTVGTFASNVVSERRVNPVFSEDDFAKWNGAGGADFIRVDKDDLNCPNKSFVVGAQARYYGEVDSSTDPEGLNGLRLLCSDDPSVLTLESTASTDDGVWSTPKRASEGL